jgi:hypothetical protein
MLLFSANQGIGNWIKTMRGKPTPPDKIEEIKALSLIYHPHTISAKLAIPLRTVYQVLSKHDNPALEARRAQKRLEVVDKVWDKTEADARELKAKMDMILEGINQGKVDRARLTELSTAYGTLFDKTRLLTGQSTENISIHAKLDELGCRLDTEKELIALLEDELNRREEQGGLEVAEGVGEEDVRREGDLGN